jgi:hypothetical protein
MSETNSAGGDQSDARLEQLKAADPARNVAPDLPRLEATVRDRIAAHPAHDDGLDEISGRRNRYTPAWTGWVAAAAAAAVVVGGGGFALGRTSAPPGEPAGAVISTGRQEASGQGADTAGGQEGGAGVRSGTAYQTDMSAPAFAGRIVFTASGFSSAGGSAKAWSFAPVRVFSRATAHRLMDTLGMKGEAQLLDGAWLAGAQDGSAAMLRIDPDGVTSFSYYDPTKDPAMCMKEQEIRKQDSGASDPESPQDLRTTNRGCDPVNSPPPPAPEGKEAVRKTRELLSSFGVDPNAFEFEQLGEVNSFMTHITAHAVVDGHRSGATWSMSWVEDGLQSLNGALAPIVSLGSYDIVSEREAVARLVDPRFGAGGSYGIFAGDTRGGTTLQGGGSVSGSTGKTETTQERTVPPTPEAGSAISWPVENVTLTKARLGIAMHMQHGGAALLLPTYELSSSDGRSWSVLAIADKQLDFATKQ